MGVVVSHPLGVDIQNRIIEFGEPRRCLDVCGVFRNAFIAFNASERKKEVEDIVQLVNANIVDLIGLAVPAVNLLTVGRKKDTRRMFL
ncbi:MAG: hypothetical protein Q8R74_08725 [Methylophilus sp.]|nr:hypothetical protein [Methylophilus sp.]